MELSRKLKSIQPSATLTINAKAAELRAQGVDVISFAVGEPDFDTPAHIRQAAKEAMDKGFTRYTPNDGIPELKKAVVEKFKKDNGLSYAPDQVIVNVGGKHSGYLVMQALLNPGDEVIVPAPYWVSYHPMVVLAGGTPVVVPTRQEDEFKLTVDQLKKALTPKTKAVIINSPSNPTGSVYGAQELRPLAEACAAADLLMMSDEMYESIIFDGLKFVSTAGLGDDIFNKTVTLNGVSKAYAMTGWRIGYMAGPLELIKACSKIQSHSTSNACSIAQKAAVAALTGPQDEVRAMAAEFEKRRDYIVKRLGEIKGAVCPPPRGAFYVFPNFLAYYGKSANGKAIQGSKDMSAYLLEAAHVATVPGVEFGEDSCIRISYATSQKLIASGMDRIQEALAKLT